MAQVFSFEFCQIFKNIFFHAFQTNGTGSRSVELIGTFKRAGLQRLSSNKHTLQIFSNQPQASCYNRCLQQVL